MAGCCPQSGEIVQLYQAAVEAAAGPVKARFSATVEREARPEC
jgi:hypothetical protein